ncbi:hypothetical protein PR202_ga15256 [Eleusine coracana subsp. coracana]|uniref:RING-type E3 ubiquitin transferase n=1 Tax=Eleusine coracana subsp. coracana TaxID=191504 RepID=A0AAV5CJR0_ELECO|nr:hypothetical protein QOZ80_6BG0495130 [Eleusine coracana subsp. coracana]GJM98266.1 hypothetical protein PR202_ga15256 [Eleusine coracana subsp. coracana]
MDRDRDPPNRGVDIFQPGVVFAAGITIAFMVAVLFVSGASYFIVLLFGAIGFLSFTVIFHCVDVYRAHNNGEDVEAPRAIASHGTGTRRNQRRDPAIAIAQLRELNKAAEAGGDDGAGGGSDADDECVVCLGKVGGDGLATRKLAACRHVFHKHCIEQWLRAHPTCPVCRGNARQESLEVISRLYT